MENTRWLERVTSGEYRRERLGLGDGNLDSDPPEMGWRREPVREYCDGPIEGVEFKPLKQHSDQRGWLIELYREDELREADRPAMSYVSETQPGVVRGSHEHVDQTDYFAFIGPGDLRIYLWDARPDSPTFGRRLSRVVGESDPQTVIVPPGVVHAYKNVSDEPAWVFNAPNRLYAGRNKQQPVDEICHEDQKDSPFQLF